MHNKECAYFEMLNIMCYNRKENKTSRITHKVTKNGKITNLTGPLCAHHMGQVSIKSTEIDIKRLQSLMSTLPIYQHHLVMWKWLEQTTKNIKFSKNWIKPNQTNHHTNRWDPIPVPPHPPTLSQLIQVSFQKTFHIT